MTASGAKLIGWIKPDDGEREDGKLLDYECLRLNPWLASKGIDGLRIEVALSRADPNHTPEDLVATGQIERLSEPATTLATNGADLIAWVCTSGSFVGGRVWAERQADDLARLSGRPATSTSLAIVDALRASAVGEVDLMSPYPPALTDRLIGFLRDHEIDVAERTTLDCPTGGASHRFDIVDALQQFVDRIDESERPILIPDTAINTLDLGDRLEAVARRPVLTANQATLWHVARRLGVPLRIARAGSLLQRGMLG